MSKQRICVCMKDRWGTIYNHDKNGCEGSKRSNKCPGCWATNVHSEWCMVQDGRPHFDPLSQATL